MAEKLDMKSMDITEENVRKIQQVFPNCVTEVIENGKVTLAVDFDALKEELTGNIITDKQERYQFTWPDKAKAKQNAVSPISATLRPCKEESVDFDTTQNLYIEGDNLDVLKLLQETYLGKVKMIYIDPPYNTGNDFVYNDDFTQDADEYMENSGQYDEQGNRLVKNLDSNGRFHTDWLNLMYPRLKLAKDLLSDDGLVFISIDDNEYENLKRICNEIFGQDNFIASIAWRRQDGQTNIGNFARVKEYILIFAKSQNCNIGRMPLSEKAKKDYQYKDEKGYYGRGRLREPVRGRHNYELISPNGTVVKGPWLIPESEFRKLESDGLIHWPEKEDGSPRRKIYLQDMLDKGQIPNDFWGIEVGTNQRASLEVESIFNKRLFDFPKPVSLLKTLLNIGTEKNSIILDFFSGSATTAHAVMQLNAEDGGNRKFIMVQLPELCDEKSEAFKAGYKNICEIGKERIRRAGAKIYEEKRKAKGLPTRVDLFNQVLATNEPEQVHKLSQKYDEAMEGLDVGFRVLKLDSSNMQPVYYNPHAMQQSLLDSTIDNVKPDRTPMDLLFQVMLDLGVLLSAKIEEKQINGKKYYVVNGNDLIACFDDDLDNSVIIEIAKQKPLYAVFKDKSFATDSVGINNEQLFKTYSPTTIVKVI